MATSFLGYTFTNPALLEEALTTPSCRMSNPDAHDNQRLEFLGDAVLGLLAADQLYREFVYKGEGELTIRRTRLVSTDALSAAAKRIGLEPLLKRNRGAAGLAADTHTLADAVEAVLGAVWLDGGLDAARTVFIALRLEENVSHDKWNGNPKGALQLVAQKMKPPRQPLYTLISKSGESHAPVFRILAQVHGLGEAEAQGRSRREAEAAAARKLLEVAAK